MSDNHNSEITIKALFLESFYRWFLLVQMLWVFCWNDGISIHTSSCNLNGVLSLFKNSNIRENNIVQTAASAGESLAAGVIFTIPALVLLGYWDSFNYFEVAKIAAIGGVIGVLFTVPLRRALIINAKLKYPEGIATAAVLKAGDKAKKGEASEGGGLWNNCTTGLSGGLM